MTTLREWRRQEAAEQKLPAYCVFTDATLVAIAEARPRSVAGSDEGAGPGPNKGRQVWRASAWRSSPRRPVTGGNHLPNAPGGAKKRPKRTKKMQLHRFAILP